MLKAVGVGLVSISMFMLGCSAQQKKTAQAQKIVDSRVRVKIQDIKLSPSDLLVCGLIEHPTGSTESAKGIQIESKRLNDDDVSIRLIEGKGEYAIFKYVGPIQELGLYTLKGQEEEEFVKIEIQFVKEDSNLSLEGVTVGTAYDATPFTLECVNDPKEEFKPLDTEKD